MTKKYSVNLKGQLQRKKGKKNICMVGNLDWYPWTVIQTYLKYLSITNTGLTCQHVEMWEGKDV